MRRLITSVVVVVVLLTVSAIAYASTSYYNLIPQAGQEVGNSPVLSTQSITWFQVGSGSGWWRVGFMKNGARYSNLCHDMNCAANASQWALGSANAHCSNVISGYSYLTNCRYP